MGAKKENVVMQDDYAAFSDGIMRAERILAERERRLEARSARLFAKRAMLRPMIGLMAIGAGLFTAGAVFAVFIGQG